jgi:hypothetical protein
MTVDRVDGFALVCTHARPVHTVSTVSFYLRLPVIGNTVPVQRLQEWLVIGDWRLPVL